MNDAIKIMLSRYNCKSTADYENALKEIIQEITLLGLWRSKYFEKAAFYGGSALRILYGLDRFSEDLDFSLLKKNKNFSLNKYCKAIEIELKSFGFSVTIEKKKKSVDSNIDSAFIKAGTLQNMIMIDTPKLTTQRIHPRKKMKIRIEVDVDPPQDFQVEAKYLFHPLPFSVNTYVQPDLFAGKLHAVLCRSWGNRVKGRDWYDLVWYVSRDISVHLKHLENRMGQTGNLKKGIYLTEKMLKEMLLEKVKTINFDKAKKDVENLLKDTSSIKLWSKEYFRAVCQKIKTS
jgi:predicted nucleotidyltransferase component of viral defense system